MKNLFSILLISVLLISCSSDDTAQEDTFNQKINPPSWLIGQWKYQNSDDLGFTFTNDNMIEGEINGTVYDYINWKENVNSIELKVVEKQQADNYIVEFYHTRGLPEPRLFVYREFIRVSNTEVHRRISANSDSVLKLFKEN